MELEITNALKLVTDKLEGWLETLIAMLPNFVVAVFVLLAFFLIARLLRRLAHRIFGKFSGRTALNDLFANVLYFGVLAVGIFVALSVLQLTQVVTTLLAGVGIVGLALGFAFQDITANFVSGILIVMRRPFEVGDIISSDDHMGVVTNINLRITTVRTFQGLEVLIPNKQLFQNVVVNYTHTKDRRVDLAVGVSYGDDLRKVKDLTLKVVSGLDSIDKTKEVTLFFDEFGDSSINFKVRFWAKSSGQLDFLTARSEAIMAIKEAFDENDITIPFPIRTLDFGIKGGEKLSEMKILNHEEN